MRQRQRAGWSNLQQVGLRVVGLWCVVVWAVIGLASPSVSMAWPRDVKAITHQGQRAMVYLPPKVHPDKPVPLLVGLHSWSTDYRQGRGVELARWCIEHGWAFIHPNFQGGNRHPNATGSPRAIADVIDAVDYIKTQTHVDEDRIYAMGWSGGGMMGLLLAAHHPDIWAGISVWGPVTDMYTWYDHVERHRRFNYTRDMKMTFGSRPGLDPKIDALYKQRSPLTHMAKARGIPIDIQVGILDGTKKGPVPVNHALRAFNLLVSPEDQFTSEDMAFIDRHASLPSTMPAQKLNATGYGRQVPIYRRTSGPVRLTLFMGGHAYMPEPGLRWLAKQRRSETLLRLGQQALVEQLGGVVTHWQALMGAVVQVLFGPVQGLVAAFTL